MKIAKIEVCDFRGFPGPAVYDFEFGNARNLLVYGENGSGKSSLFRAIQEFFNRASRPKPFDAFKNIEQPNLTDGRVTLDFDTGEIQSWPHRGTRSTTPPAAQVALQVGCLDYRSLLETNFSQKGETVNLFEIAVNHLVDRMQVNVPGGGSARIGDLWRNVVNSMPWRNYQRSVRECQFALDNFNAAFEPVLSPLISKASELLQLFPDCNLEVGLSFQPVQYRLKPKAFTNQELLLTVKRNGATLPNHHDFLNEARLSAIGLVIYLAGLLITVPPNSLYPKVLVLDDVLIGLDMDNRMPVLQILDQYFAGWQVILLTHDKVWYEEVIQHFGMGPNWKAYELHVGENNQPRHQARGGGADFFLVRAQQHLNANDHNSAANYARAAFESKIKAYCEKHGVPVPYNRTPRKVQAEDLWGAAKTHAMAKATSPTVAATDPALAVALRPLFAAVDAWKSIVLNPLSHSTTAPVMRSEVKAALDAVQKLRFK